MANRYLRASGNWNGPVWAATSSGAAGSASTPTADDFVFIYANYTVTLTADAICKGVDHTNGTLKLNGRKLTIYTSDDGGYVSYGNSARTLNLSNSTLEIHATSFYLGGTNQTILSSGSLIKIQTYNSTSTPPTTEHYFDTNNKTFNDVVIEMGVGVSTASTLNITGSPTFRSLIIQSENSAAHTVNLSGLVTITHLELYGASTANRLTINGRQTVPGGAAPVDFTANGSSAGNYVRMQGVWVRNNPGNIPTYIGANSIQESGSSGWLIQSPNNPPTARFSASPKSGKRPVTVYFTDLSTFAPISWSWDFGDGGTSTTKNPQHTYSSGGNYTVSLVATNAYGSDIETKTDYITIDIESFSGEIDGSIKFSGGATRKYLASRSISGTILFSGGARAIVIRDAEAIQDKRYLYKVYDPDGNYIEVWKDVISDLTFTHEINTIGSSATIELARNSDTVGVSVEPLLTEDSQNLLTEDDLTILGSIESKNQIGSGSSVDYNNRVDVTVFYGGVEPLYTESMESLLTEDDEELLADVGAPNGRRIFTGFISEINSRYGNSETTIVQLTSYGWDLDQFPITTSDGKTTVPFLSKDPSQIAKDAVDKFRKDSSAYGTYTTRDLLSIDTTGTVVSYTFRANTYKDVLEKTLELMPSNWYYRVGLGDNLVYYKERRATPHHLFYLGKHIKSLDLKGSIINSTNRVLFTGGGEPNLYIDRSEVPADRTRRTLKMMSDNRVTVLDSAEIIADGAIDGSNKRLFRTTIEILTKQYDIESINIGETVGFRNFGNEVDTFTMQILGLTYTPDSVQLQLETKPPTVSKRLEDLRRNMTVNENSGIPDAPTT